LVSSVYIEIITRELYFTLMYIIGLGKHTLMDMMELNEQPLQVKLL